MKVRLHPADKGGCGHYRMIFPAEACAKDGHDVAVDYDRDYQAYWQNTPFGERLVGLAEDVDSDVVVMQRPLRRDRLELMRALQAQGVAVVIEIDDDFHAVHKRNPAWKDTSPLADPDRNRDWLMKACREADLVTTTTPALAQRYGAHGRVAVLPNYVPSKYLTVEPSDYTAEFLDTIEGVTVGWTGSVITHPDDLEATGGAVGRVCDETGARFHVVGTGKGVAKALGLSVEPSNTGWLPIEAYPEAIRQIDVGIVPLAAHPFNEAKSWLKGLEFASLGVPFVATPTGPYRDLWLKHDLGECANTPAAWETALHWLMDDEYRAEKAGRGRETASTLTYEANAWRWMEAWEQAVANRDVRRQEAAA